MGPQDVQTSTAVRPPGGEPLAHSGAPGAVGSLSLKLQHPSPSHADIETKTDEGGPVQGTPPNDEHQQILQVVKEGRGLRTWAHQKAAEGVEGPSRRKPASRFKGDDEDSANGADIHPAETLGKMEFRIRGHQPLCCLVRGGSHPRGSETESSSSCELWLRPSSRTLLGGNRDTALPGLAQRQTLPARAA